MLAVANGTMEMGRLRGPLATASKQWPHSDPLDYTSSNKHASTKVSVNTIPQGDVD